MGVWLSSEESTGSTCICCTRPRSDLCRSWVANQASPCLALVPEQLAQAQPDNWRYAVGTGRATVTRAAGSLAHFGVQGAVTPKRNFTGGEPEVMGCCKLHTTDAKCGLVKIRSPIALKSVLCQPWLTRVAKE